MEIPMAKVTITISDSRDGGVIVDVVTNNEKEQSTANEIGRLLSHWCSNNVRLDSAVPQVQEGEARCH